MFFCRQRFQIAMRLACLEDCPQANQRHVARSRRAHGPQFVSVRPECELGADFVEPQVANAFFQRFVMRLFSNDRARLFGPDASSIGR